MPNADPLALVEEDHLDAIEARSIYVIREAFSRFARPGMLWSIGKDSNVLLWLTRKAFLGDVPFPLIHIDTSFQPPEMIEFRDRLAAEWGLDLRVRRNHAALQRGQSHPQGGATRVECCTVLKRDPLVGVVEELELDAVLAGIRRDEEGTRAKERYFSPRGLDHTWDFREQPAELWDQYKTDFPPGAHVRVHPLLHWTETDIWLYIRREGIPVVPLYFSDEHGLRNRSLGCAPCTGTIESPAKNVDEILVELRRTRIAERATRAQDQEAEDAFERLRTQGYM